MRKEEEDKKKERKCCFTLSSNLILIFYAFLFSKLSLHDRIIFLCFEFNASIRVKRKKRIRKGNFYFAIEFNINFLCVSFLEIIARILNFSLLRI